MESLRYRLKDKKMRMTPQRLAVLEYIYTAKTHPTVQEIYRALLPQFEKLSLATVYNNLKALVQLGYVVEMTYGDSATRYDYKQDDNHYHAICEQCGTVLDFPFEPLNDLAKQLEESYGFKVTSQRLEAFGLCKDCQNKME